jgi:hypothetical protein
MARAVYFPCQVSFFSFSLKSVLVIRLYVQQMVGDVYFSSQSVNGFFRNLGVRLKMKWMGRD